jgi:hypothetical protein
MSYALMNTVAVTVANRPLTLNENWLNQTGPVCPFPFFRLRMAPFSAIPQRRKSGLGLKFRNG